MRITAPTRAAHIYTQHLAAPPAEVFPLLCPVREIEWADGWDPAVVFSVSGVAEPDCVFTTRGAGDLDDVWVVTRHDPAAFAVEMVMVTPAVIAMHLTITLRPEDGGCAADVSYVKTSLGAAGDEEVRSFTESAWTEFMAAWEDELNGYLRSAS